MDESRTHLEIGCVEPPDWRQVGGIETEAYGMTSNRRCARATGESECLGDLSPGAGGGDRNGQVLVGPSTLPGEVGVVEFQSVGMRAD
ncbi:hypothetical protein ACTXG7_14135 [Mycolicibacterium sp. Dal123E01]|uniref:hypothetical protein n=1 Tax=Mycolicibacterium sp. Dal123E01 TaxID=3457578 RepID=UPI00403EC2C6